MGWNANLFMTLKEKFYPKNWENYPFKWLASLLSVTAVPLVNLSKGHTSVWAVIKTEVYRQCKSIEFQFSVNQLQRMSKSGQLNWNWKPLLVILIRLPLRDCGIKMSVKLCVKWKRWFTVLVDAGSCKRKFGNEGTAWHENEVLANSSPNFNCCWLITWEPAKKYLAFTEGFDSVTPSLFPTLTFLWVFLFLKVWTKLLWLFLDRCLDEKWLKWWKRKEIWSWKEMKCVHGH